MFKALLSLAKSILGNEKAPYAVTLFVAATAWTAVHTADRVSNTPFVEYRFASAQTRAGKLGLELRLRNVTAATRFECFTLTLTPHAGAALKFGDAAYQQARVRGTVFARPIVTKASPNEWEVKVESLAPGADISLIIPIEGDGEPALLVSMCPDEAGSSVDEKADGAKKERGKPAPLVVPVLLRRSPTTFFVEFEIALLWFALVIWLVLMVMLGLSTGAKLPQRRVVTGKDEGPHNEEGSID